MNETKKFTVITATFNCLPYVGQCIRSVLSQTYSRWEMIIVDDCSSDRTYKRACEIAHKHKNITVVQNNSKLHCGLTYKKLLSMASGDICGVLDGDDVLEPHAIKTIVRYYNKYPEIDFIWTKHQWGNTKLDRFKPGLSRSAKSNTIFESEDGLRHVYSHWRTFRTNMREKGPLFRDLKCTVDKDLGYSLEELGYGGFLPIALYRYRYHGLNMSHHSSQKMVWRLVRKYHKKKKRFPSRVLK